MSTQPKPKILITGLPGCGKTTLIKKIVKIIHQPAHGFFTDEILQSGKRVGFAIETFGSPARRGILSHTDKKSKFRVGQYGVDIEAFENIAIPEIRLGLQLNTIIVIDEIGKMELFSELFKVILLQIFESDISLIASIMYKPQPFCDKLKEIPGIDLIRMDRKNRDELLDKIINKFPTKRA